MKNKSQSGYPPRKFPKSPAIEYSVEVLSNLVSFPTIHPKTDAHVACVEYLSRELESMGFQVRVFEAHNDENQVNNAGPVLLAVLQGDFDKGPHIHFNGHYDVVPAGTGWNYPPFQLTRNGKDLIGRGTADMKGGIAVMLGALHAYLEQKKIINGMLSLSIVPDEERGGKLGSWYFTKKFAIPGLIFGPTGQAQDKK
jgi:succinyl-diaminopimelate desuccinylase